MTDRGTDHGAAGGERTVAGCILDACAAAGVSHVFGLPGVHNLSFWRAAGAAPELVTVRHEQTTVYAADGLARAGGGLGVALTTTGPGAANAVAAFGEASASGSPVVLVATEVATAVAKPGVRRGALHDSRDQAQMFEPLAKAVLRPRTAADACAAMGAAIETALRAPQGPVYLDVPTDVLTRPGTAIEPHTSPPLEPEAGSLERLVACLRDAHRIVLWLGGGAVKAQAGPALSELAQRLAAPVVTTYAARGLLPPSHPCVVGLPPQEPEVAELIAGADVLLVIGSELDGMMTRNWSMPLPPVLASVNCDAAELVKNYRPDPGVLGDARRTAEALLEHEWPERPSPCEQLDALRAGVWARLRADPRSAPACSFLDALEDAAGDDAVLIADMAVTGYWTAGYAHIARPRGLQYPMGWGTLGYALPAAVGAAIRRDRPVLVVCGDGGLLFAVGELATIAEQRLPITVLVTDDGGYGMLRFDQERAGDPRRGVDLTSPDFAALAGAFGIRAAQVHGDAGELRGALQTAVQAGEPRMVVWHERLFPPRTTSPRWRE